MFLVLLGLLGCVLLGCVGSRLLCCPTLSPSAQLLAASDDDDEPEPKGEGDERLQPKQQNEQLCSSCFLLVKSSAPNCPVGDDDCPIFS